LRKPITSSDSFDMESSARAHPGLPNFYLETEMMALHGLPVAGIDEAGRGPWAGPVVVAAVVLDRNHIPEGLNDSKKLTPQAREDRFEEIAATARVSVVIGQVRRIDRDNILQATLWGMSAAFRTLEVPKATALIDGNAVPGRFPGTARAVIGGDAKSLSIAAASIVAKVTRDRIMMKLAKRYRGYGWETNKGYGTAEHADGIERHGLCPHHRRSFAPIRRILAARGAIAEVEG
jgi:ribonuclease HII